MNGVGTLRSAFLSPVNASLRFLSGISMRRAVHWRSLTALVLAGACARASIVPVPAAVPAPARTVPKVMEISEADLRAHLEAFSADSMMGRYAGSIWDAKAAEWIASQFRQLGLRPAGEDDTFFQAVPGMRLDDSLHGAPARNVVAIVPGSDPALRGEYVSITAHNDHIGFNHRPVDHDSLRAYNTVVRPMGADSRPRTPNTAEAARIRVILDSLRAIRGPRADSINNGADDDGSGTIAIIAIAHALERSGIKPRRSILFVSHTAEEEGLVGSSWYTDHSTVPMDSIVAEFDLDMVGRGARSDIKAGGPTYLEVVGLRRLSREFGDWVEAANAAEPLPFVFDYEYDAPGHPEQYYCRADHYSYARYGVPSVSLSRGGHMDYHQATDEAQYIDYPDYARLVQMVLDAARAVANADHAPRLDVPRPVDPHLPCVQ
jgi:hypothetical protein